MLAVTIPRLFHLLILDGRGACYYRSTTVILLFRDITKDWGNKIKNTKLSDGGSEIAVKYVCCHHCPLSHPIRFKLASTFLLHMFY